MIGEAELYLVDLKTVRDEIMVQEDHLGLSDYEAREHALEVVRLDSDICAIIYLSDGFSRETFSRETKNSSIIRHTEIADENGEWNSRHDCDEPGSSCVVQELT